MIAGLHPLLLIHGRGMPLRVIIVGAIILLAYCAMRGQGIRL